MDDLLSTISQATGAPVSQSAAPAPGAPATPLPLRNNNPGAVSPGGSVAQYPDMQTGLAKMDQNLASYAGKTDAQTLGQVITKWVGSPPNAPAYIKDVTGRLGIGANTPVDLTNPAQRQAISTAIMLHENGPGAVFAHRGGSAQQSAQPAPTVPGQSNSGQQPAPDSGPMSDLMDTLTSATNAPAQPAKAAPQTPATQQPETSAFARFGHSAAGLADTVLGVPGQMAQQADYAVRRAFQQNPQQAQAASQGDFGASTHPVGNAFGVTNTPGYQGEATQRAAGAIGNVVGQGVNAVASATGAAPQDVANMAGSAALLVPGAAKAVGRVAGDAAVATAADDVASRATVPANPVGPAMQARPMVGGGSASTNLNPYPQLTGEDAARGAFPQIKLSKVAQDVTPDEQTLRANIANQIMGDNGGSVRTGVITGNENTLRDEYAAAKTPNQTAATQAIRTQIANEQQSLANYAEQRVNATGASQSVTGNEERGRIINDALYGDENSLTSYLQDAKRQIYDQARASAGDNPITTNHVDTLFNDPQFQAGVRLRGNESALAGAQDLIQLARTTGFRDPVTGEMYAPGSVAAWDAVRKSINSNWSPANASTIRAVNGSIDQDIAATGGQEMYKLGDRIHQVEKTLLDSRGIGSVLGEYDANGIKTGPSLESVPSKLNSMPMDQWQHIHDTLDDLSRGQVRGAPDGMPAVPTEVQQAAAQAKAEMDGSLARSVYEAGSDKAGAWNQNSVNKVLNSSVGQKITRNFAPDEVQAFHTLNYGGQIMPGVHSYEGAGNQLSRLQKPGFVEKYAPRAAATTGAAIGGAIPIPGAGWLAAAAGERLGTKLSNAAAAKSARANFENVTNEMHQNSLLGDQSPGVPLNSLVKKGRP